MKSAVNVDHCTFLHRRQQDGSFLGGCRLYCSFLPGGRSTLGDAVAIFTALLITPSERKYFTVSWKVLLPPTILKNFSQSGNLEKQGTH